MLLTAWSSRVKYKAGLPSSLFARMEAMNDVMRWSLVQREPSHQRHLASSRYTIALFSSRRSSRHDNHYLAPFIETIQSVTDDPEAHRTMPIAVAHDFSSTAHVQATNP